MAEFKETWPTTVDNPFDPFPQWDEWYRYDEKCGYHTCSRLAMLSRNSNELSEAESEQSITQAILTLIDWYEPYGVYRLAVQGQTQRFGFAQQN